MTAKETKQYREAAKRFLERRGSPVPTWKKVIKREAEARKAMKE